MYLTPISSDHERNQDMSYIAPLKDMLFNIEHLARIDQIAQIPGFEDAGLETAQAVLEECAKLNQDVIPYSPTSSISSWSTHTLLG